MNHSILHSKELTMRCCVALFLSVLVCCANAFTQSAKPSATDTYEPFVLSAQYKEVQRHLAQGWNTWDANSVTTHVLLPQGLAIHVSIKHNSTESGDALLADTLIGRFGNSAEQVKPGPHAWDGSYTDLRVMWMGHAWRVQSAHDGKDLVLLATPLASQTKAALAPTIIFSVDYLWNREGTVSFTENHGAGSGMIARSAAGEVPIYCTCSRDDGSSLSPRVLNISPITGPYFATDFTEPVAVTTGKALSVAEAQAVVEGARVKYEQSLAGDKTTQPLEDAIETTLGWDTIYEPEKGHVVSPVSRVWSVNWGGYVIFDWDTFFAATMASIGNRDLAYADAVETLRESTREGFVPNYARAGNWKSYDRSEPPVGAITVLGLYRKFGDLWFLEQTFPQLLKWNRWWAQHRDVDGYLTWGSDGKNLPGNFDDDSRGTRAGAILESGLDNSPMYDDAVYDERTHLLEFADVGLMSMYIADCEALAKIADALHKDAEARELRERSGHYRAKLQALWNGDAGIFENKDLHTGKMSSRLSPTNFYPMLAHAATPQQAQKMVDKHLLNTDEFWGEWVIPSIARNDAAFRDQNYWRGRIWGPMNYLVYLGLENYDVPKVRREFAEKSYALFLKEWTEKGHVHENYNAVLGTGDDVGSSDRFYHWGALLGFVEYLEQTTGK
ncbi:trehalase family glycosidase [Acidicapsa dinghuensis]|uniref:Trehalase family glycosidase n=1 Tax=Acidicapsa dinghuensis TaxID=2218256 RepID=A0ABW1ENU0_9BACT|nr:alpha,alpha-trehalase [Acidicapsa dinghuensis]